MKKILRTAVITIVFALVSFYFTLPALNFRSPAFYGWLLEVAVVYVLASLIGTFSVSDLKNRTVDFKFLKTNAKIGILIIAVSVGCTRTGTCGFPSVFPRFGLSENDACGKQGVF